MKRLLGIWLRDWPIQRLRSGLAAESPGEIERPDPAHDPHLPVILWQTDPRRGRLVVACCRRSRALGIRPAMPIAQATELAISAARPRSGEAMPVVSEHDSAADAAALGIVATALGRAISPLVATETLDDRPFAGRTLNEGDTLLCDLTGVTHLFGGEAGVLKAVHRCLAGLGLAAKLAIADNAAAAWAHAHYQAQDDFISTHLLADLEPLPVSGLRIATETRHTLDRLGVETIGALMRLPRSGLAGRLGESLVRRIAEVSGELEVPLTMHHIEETCTATHALEYPTDDFEILADRIDRLTEEIVASLATSQRGALRLACRLDLAGHSRLENVIGFFAPTLEGKHIGNLLKSALESRRLSSEAKRITLSVLQSAPLRTTQTSLFGDADFGLDSATTGRSLSRLIDELTGRLGRAAVLGVRLSDDPLPERAYRTFSLTDHHARRMLRPSRNPTRAADRSTRPGLRHYHFRAPTPDDARRRPLRLLRKPLTLEMQRGSADGTLPVFRLENRPHQVVHYWGPERIETQWWDGPSVRRDYYRVETDSGQTWWVYRDLKSSPERWYLHGRFS